MNLQDHLISLPKLYDEEFKHSQFIDHTKIKDFLLQSNKDCAKLVIDEFKTILAMYSYKDIEAFAKECEVPDAVAAERWFDYQISQLESELTSAIKE